MKPYLKSSSLLAAWLILPLASLHAADLKVATIFGNHAVLQRDILVPVWGWADAGTEVTVEFAGQKKTAKTGADGKWQVKLDKLATSAESRELKVSAGGDKAPVVLTDILVGEVWLGSGQSNMAMTVNRADNYEQEQAAANLPNVRMFVEKGTSEPKALADGKGEWRATTPETVGGFSAALFFFGREIHKKLGVPVGLINSSVGGTPIEAWIDQDTQMAVPELAAAAKAAPARAPVSPEVAMENYKKLLARWEVLAKKAKENNTEMPRKPRDPSAVSTRKNEVGGLFNGKIAPLIPYAIRGALWYQGEANSGPEKAFLYGTQLSLLIKDWRKRWGYEFPFAWAQLPNFGVVGRDWPTMREQMLKTLSVPHTGMGINIDIGEEKNIHPKNKQEVGRRLSMWALGTVYDGKVDSTSGPLPAGNEVGNGKVVVSFTHADKGLVAKDGELKGFLIAGEDQQWKPAQAKIVGDKVEVSSAEVAKPVAVRYAWENWPTCNLYNGAGLPASPFRTDSWKWTPPVPEVKPRAAAKPKAPAKPKAAK